MSVGATFQRAAARAAFPLLKRWYGWWNGSERRVRADGLDLIVQPGVFHPDLFQSTRSLAAFITTLPLAGRTFLDLGTGAGRIALTAARCGARVTASDVNPAATDCARTNAERNGLEITAVLSDQFDRLPDAFQVIAINPPYYPRDPKGPGERAFYTGEGHAYFQRILPELARRVRAGAEVYMVLSEALDMAPLLTLARDASVSFDPMHSITRWGERTTVFTLRPSRENAPDTVSTTVRPGAIRT